MAEFVGVRAEKNIEPAGEIVLFESSDAEVRLPVSLEDDAVWLSQAQMAELFGRSVAVVSRHIANVFAEKELVKAVICIFCILLGHLSRSPSTASM